MNKKNVFALAVMPILFVACSKDDSKNNAAVKDGYCTSATVDAFNSITSSARLFKLYKDQTSLTATHNSCVSYKSLVAGNSCKLSLSGVDTTVNSTSQDGVCSPVAQAMADINQIPNQTGNTSRPPRNQTGTTPADVVSAEDRQMILAVSGGIKVKVLNSVKLSDAGIEEMYFQAGHAMKLGDLRLLMSQPMCTFMTTVQPLISGESKLYFDTFKISDIQKTVTLTSSKDVGVGTYTQITCRNGEGKEASDLTLGDLKSIFEEVLEIKLVK